MNRTQSDSISEKSGCKVYDGKRVDYDTGISEHTTFK